MIEKSFEEWLSYLLTNYKNQAENINPNAVIDISVGSAAYMRFAATASALWSLQNYVKWVKKQQTPFQCDVDRLTEFAQLKEVQTLPDESTESLRSRVIAAFSDATANGKPSDWESWAKSFASPYSKTTIPDQSVYLGCGSTNSDYDDDLVFDGELDDTAWTTDSWIPDYYVRVDFGTTLECRMVMLYLSAAGSETTYNVQCSDDNATWTTVASLKSELAGWNTAEWNSAGSHRHWRLVCTNTPANGPSVTEMEWYITGSEQVTDAWCEPGAQGGGSVDVYVVSGVNGAKNIPSNGLLVKLMEYFDTVRNATSKYRRALAPTFVSNNYLLAVSGNADKIGIRDAIIALFNSLRMGQSLLYVDVVVIAKSYGATNIISSNPNYDLVPTAHQLLRAENVTVL